MNTIYKKNALSILFLFGFILTSFAQNPTVLNGVATYHTSTNIGRKCLVRPEWNKIVINANVTLTGSFYMPTRTTPIEIMGKDRKTSIIQGDGSRPTDDFDANGEPLKGRSYSAIRADLSPDIYVHDLKITKPMKFHIHGGFGNVTVERCDIIAGSETHTTDGIHGGKGKTVIKDCYIDVFDDALYTIECKLVENTTIVHNSNGGPFMTSWGADVPANHTCVVRNCKVIGNSTGYYAHGVFSWAQKSDDIAQTIHIKIEGSFDYVVNPGKAAAPMYTIARPNNSDTPPPVVNNATIRIDGTCPSINSIELRPTAQNCTVTFENCNSTNYIFIDHNSSGKRLRGGTDNLVSTQVGGVGDMVQWAQQATDNGYFFLIHKATGKKLQGTSSFAVGLVDPSKNGTWEQWKWVDAGSGWYRLENRGHNRWLHVDANGTTNWTIAPKTTTNNNTKWKYSNQNASTFRLKKEVAEIEADHKDEVTLYPNPVSTTLNISGLNSTSEVEIYRHTGQKVIKSRGKSQIDVSSLASGVYLVKVDQTTTLKFIKE